MMPWLPVLLALLGLVAGSFLATVAVRWPAARSLGGRSACDGCGATLTSAELVPLLSWLALRGRCRRCAAPIDGAHTAIELACMAVGAGAGLLVPGWDALAWAAFGWTLVLLAALDARAMWLPDVLTLPLAAAGLLQGALSNGVMSSGPAITDRLIGCAAGYAALALVAFAYRQVRGRDGIGGGDPKLFAAIGAWLGWAALPPVLLIASVIGLTLVAGRAVRGQGISATDMLPLGTLLAVAALAVAPWVLLGAAAG